MEHKTKVVFFSLSSYELFFKTENVEHGGAELQLYLLANEMAKKNNFSVKFIVGDYQQNKSVFSDNIEFIKAFNLPKKESYFLKLIKGLKLFLIFRKIDADVIITTAANSIIGIAFIYKYLFRKKHIHRTAHLIDVDKTWIQKNGLLGKIYEIGINNVDIVITQNIEHKELLASNHQINAVVLKNAFPIPKKKKHTKTNVLWVGRYESWKNPEKILKIAKKLKELEFIMICPKPEISLLSWETLKKNASKIKNLSFINKVPFNQIQTYFNNARVFVNTSESEGFPNTFLQAAAASTPIASLNVNPDNYISDNKCGLFANNNFKKLEENIKNLYFNDKMHMEYGNNNFSYLNENHNLIKIDNQFSEIVEKLCYSNKN